ncbi:MAG: hypothetical protein RIR79_1184 [Pseudomonadota bacterium]|jgi:peptidoglycan-associated lipoprotein
MKRLVWAMTITMAMAGAAMLLSACSSGVPLNETPPDDSTGIPPGQGIHVTSGGGDSAPAGQSTVRGVSLNNVSRDNEVVSSNRVVYFDFDSFVIRPEFQILIEAHAKHLKTDKSRQIAIEGHTDERGGREYNLALGQKRAEAVRRALMLQGVSDAQIEAVSFGKERPAMQGGSDQAMAKNRRAEILYVATR